MKLEQQVCSLGLAKKLSELGAKQKSIVKWQRFKHPEEHWELRHYSDFRPQISDENDDVSAFTIAELGVMLPAQLPGPSYKHPAYRLAMEKQDTRWNIVYICATCGGREFEPMLADTEADARAKMLIYLLENGLLEATQ